MSNNDEPFNFLICGVDTAEAAYFLSATDYQTALNYDDLLAQRELLRSMKGNARKAITLGCEEFLLHGHGTKSGYPLFIENKLFHVSFGEFNRPNFFVKYLSEALWHDGLENLHNRFLAWAASVGFEPYQPESLSRVDYAFDYLIPHVDFDMDSFKTVAVVNAQYRKRRTYQTFDFGSGDVKLRVYNKSDEIKDSSDKTWFYPIWEAALNG